MEPSTKTLICRRWAGNERIGAGSASAEKSQRGWQAHLEEVGEVDEHVTRLVHPAGAVEACSDDILSPSALDKVHVDGEVEVALAGIGETVGESESVRELLDAPATCCRSIVSSGQPRAEGGKTSRRASVPFSIVCSRDS